MDKPNAFQSRFESDIEAAIGCPDRVIFKGHMFQGGSRELNRFVDRLGILRKDFIPHLDALSEQLANHAKELAGQAGARYEPPNQKTYDKEKRVDEIDRERRHPDGLVAVLCVMEHSTAVRLIGGKNRPELKFMARPQRVLYYYYNDQQFGRIHVRVETWFPFTVQVYVNGHSWLGQQMARLRMGFVQEDNAFTELDDPKRAQALADKFIRLDWVSILEKWSRPLLPVLKHPWFCRMNHHWTTDQFEYSVDLIFRSPERLAKLFPLLLIHALTCFSARDVLTFLGRRLAHSFDGEVITQCKRDRIPGARIKHSVRHNWLKMYDKSGRILRVEMVLNQANEFQILRWGTKKGQRVYDWFRMAKRVTNLWRYAEIAQQACQRYLNALAAVHDITPAMEILEVACRPAGSGRRRRRGLMPLHASDQQLFRAVMQGEHIVNGFRNRNIKEILFPIQSPDRKKRLQQSAHVTRRLQLLRVHGLIRKAGRLRKYHVTSKGFQLMGAAISIQDDRMPNLIERLNRLANAS